MGNGLEGHFGSTLLLAIFNLILLLFGLGGLSFLFFSRSIASGSTVFLVLFFLRNRSGLSSLDGNFFLFGPALD